MVQKKGVSVLFKLQMAPWSLPPFIFFPVNLNTKHNHFFVPVLGGKLSMTQLDTVIREQIFFILTGLSHCCSFVISTDWSWTKALCNNLANFEKQSMLYFNIFLHIICENSL